MGEAADTGQGSTHGAEVPQAHEFLHYLGMSSRSPLSLLSPRRLPAHVPGQPPISAAVTRSLALVRQNLATVLQTYRGPLIRR